MLYYNLHPIFKLRGIDRPHTFLRKNGFSAFTSQTLVHGNSRTMRLDHLERLCKILICEPTDLLTWIPEKHEALPETHPLHGLKAKSNETEGIYDSLSHLSVKQLKEISKEVTSKKKLD